MKYKFLLIGFFLLICSCKTGIKISNDSNKNIEIVDPNYEILSIADKTRTGLLPLMWKCYSIQDVEVKYRTWPDTDPMAPHKVIDVMCDFEIWVHSQPFKNVYHGRRGKPEKYCTDFKDAWNKLTQNEAYICMDGETLTKGEPEKDSESKKMRASWTWDKIKTKKGCYSFWDDYQCSNF